MTCPQLFAESIVSHGIAASAVGESLQPEQFVLSCLL